MKKGSNKISVLCVEIDFSSFVNSIKLSKSINFEFGVFNIININLSMVSLTDILMVLDNRNSLYSELFNTYNNTKNTPSPLLLNISDTTKLLNYFSLYHFIYFNTTRILNEHPELKPNTSKYLEEYTYVVKKIFAIEYEFKYINKQEFYSFTFNRTICRKKPLRNEYECVIDENEMRIIPLVINMNKLNEEFIETSEIGSEHYDLFIYSITTTNPKINEVNINTIMRIKLLRITFFYNLLAFIFFCFFILFINMISEYAFDFIEKLINNVNNIEIDDEKIEINYLKENKNISPIGEMVKLKEIYETTRKSLIIKHAFNKELYLHKYHFDFYDLIKDIQKQIIKEICNSFIAYFHYNNNIFNLSENEFHSTIDFIQENENRIKSGESSENDNKLKDTIKRSSIVTYLNEYSTFDNIDENMLDIIYLKIFKQRFIYLYAMNKFKLANEINIGNNNIIQNNPGDENKNKKNKKNKEKKINYYKGAIKNFQECHNINALLGINQIKIIYSLIMISKCYMQLNDYKNAMININKSLTLYFKFSKTFQDYHRKYYNPKVMLFIESNIFHYILFTISKICNTFNKPCESNWIILKIFESSPFFLSNIHYQACISLFHFLDRNKTKMNKYEPNFYKNAIIMKEGEKLRKYYIKIISRLYTKNSTNKNEREKTKKLGDSMYNTSNKTTTVIESVAKKSKLSSHLKKEMATSKISSAFHDKARKLNKNITICLSEKILEKINGQELKDVLIKYFKKYFLMNENDKFSFVQFAKNGKKTVLIKLESLNIFLWKFQKTKGIFEIRDSYKSNKDLIFEKLYNIMDSIIKNYPQTEEADNIIIFFID